MATQSTPKNAPAGKAAEGKAEAAEAAPAKSKSKLIIIIVAVVLVLVSAGAGAWFMTRKTAHEPAAEEDAAAEEEGGAEDSDKAKAKAKGKEKDAHTKPLFVPVEPFTVNLQRDDSDHYLQLTMVIKASEPATVDAIKLYMPQLRNNVLLLLSSKQAKDLDTADAKKKLATEITEVAKQSVAAPVAEDIAGVFFTSFLIQ